MHSRCPHQFPVKNDCYLTAISIYEYTSFFFFAISQVIMSTLLFFFLRFLRWYGKTQDKLGLLGLFVRTKGLLYRSSTNLAVTSSTILVKMFFHQPLLSWDQNGREFHRSLLGVRVWLLQLLALRKWKLRKRELCRTYSPHQRGLCQILWTLPVLLFLQC